MKKGKRQQGTQKEREKEKERERDGIFYRVFLTIFDRAFCGQHMTIVGYFAVRLVSCWDGFEPIWGPIWVTLGHFWVILGSCWHHWMSFDHMFLVILVLIFPAVLAIFVFKVFTAILSLFSGVSQLSMQI